MSNFVRIVSLLTAVALAALVATPVASAHIGVFPDTITRGNQTLITFAFSHDCAGDGTSAIEMSIPKGVVTFRPVASAGWSITQEGAQGAGGMTDMETPSAAKSVKWTHEGGPVPTDQAGALSAIVIVNDDAEGDMLWFPTIQSCPGGKNFEWIETATSHEAAQELELSAPYAMLSGKASAEHGHSAAATAAHDGSDEEKTTSSAPDPSRAEKTANSARTIAIAALLLAVALGIWFLLAGRRKKN